VRTAIVGLGSAGRRHARNLLALGATDLVLVRTGVGQTHVLEAPLDSLPTAPALRDALAAGVKAVVIANPTSLHVATALEAVRADCHVLVEKPVSHKVQGLAELAAEVAARGVAFLVGYQYRFDPALERIRDLVSSGALGDLVSARSHWGEYLPDWHPEEDYRQGYSARAELGGGVLLTLSHPIDYLRWIAGEIESVAGFASRRAGLDLDVDDVASLSLRFATGALGTVTLDYAERTPAHTLYLTGTEGSVAWDPTGTTRVYRAGAGADTLHPPPGFQRNDMFLAEMRHFLACCAGAESPRCTLADGARVVEIVSGVVGDGG